MPWILVLIVKEERAAVVHPARQGRGWSAEQVVPGLRHKDGHIENLLPAAMTFCDVP